MMTEWENQPQPPPANPPLQPSKQFGESGYSTGSHDAAAAGGGVVTGALYVKVMTDEQLEILRNQIAVYASICEQLVEMHKAVTAQQDLAGARLGNLYCDPLVTSMGHKITARQRWTPTPVQLQLLEQIFEQGTGTPSKQKIKDITTELSQHGHISETNVYNWFQNRRARSKRKQLNSASNNAESEVETEADSPKDKKTNPENFLHEHESEAAGEDYCYHGQEMSSEIHSSGPRSNKEPSEFQNLGHQLAFYESMMEHSSMMEPPQFSHLFKN